MGKTQCFIVKLSTSLIVVEFLAISLGKNALRRKILNAAAHDMASIFRQKPISGPRVLRLLGQRVVAGGNSRVVGKN